jgi:hypothetical protein
MAQNIQSGMQQQQRPQSPNLYARGPRGVLTTGEGQEQEKPKESADIVMANALVVQQALKALQENNAKRGGLYGQNYWA